MEEIICENWKKITLLTIAAQPHLSCTYLDEKSNRLYLFIPPRKITHGLNTELRQAYVVLHPSGKI